ncbi:hypothetical protein GCM10010145_56110 [Streptomyces ruber]|uniref:HTH tetR-type domain-containing protein n=2 Tax=Streptomyces TaxID=1883 RepID=A0A918BM42_9ACTN|nr:TetR/AcrR family transcriptional regulator [Streptomyces ruber]GGQ79164.1 hypothetical protein GCM10010145_56110 [Streptomyces ruber]
MSVRSTGASRTDLIGDAAIQLLAERGMRGLTHRAVDEAAGLPQGSTSNRARTRQALLEIAVRRLAEREARVLVPAAMPAPGGGLDALVDVLAATLHDYLTGHRTLLVARCELALEATRRPELREVFDTAGRRFRDLVTALVTAAGSTDPARHMLSLVAWCDGMMFSCVAGSFHATVPEPRDLRRSFRELLGGMLHG